MDVGSMIQTLVATVIGGAIVIATNWISAKAKRKKQFETGMSKTISLGE